VSITNRSFRPPVDDRFTLFTVHWRLIPDITMKTAVLYAPNSPLEIEDLTLEKPHRDFPMLLDLYMFGKLKLDELIPSTYRLEEINTAFDDMLVGEAARGVILFD